MNTVKDTGMEPQQQPIRYQMSREDKYHTLLRARTSGNVDASTNIRRRMPSQPPREISADIS